MRVSYPISEEQGRNLGGIEGGLIPTLKICHSQGKNSSQCICSGQPTKVTKQERSKWPNRRL